MDLIETGLNGRIHFKVKTAIYSHIDDVSTSIEMRAENHTLEEVQSCLKEIERVVARLERAAKKIKGK